MAEELLIVVVRECVSACVRVCVWWNARSLMACSRRARAAKVGMLRQLAAGADVVMVCEVRGGEVRIARELRWFGRDFCWFHSGCDDAFAG